MVGNIYRLGIITEKRRAKKWLNMKPWRPESRWRSISVIHIHHGKKERAKTRIIWSGICSQEKRIFEIYLNGIFRVWHGYSMSDLVRRLGLKRPKINSNHYALRVT